MNSSGASSAPLVPCPPATSRCASAQTVLTIILACPDEGHRKLFSASANTVPSTRIGLQEAQQVQQQCGGCWHCP